MYLQLRAAWNLCVGLALILSTTSSALVGAVGADVAVCVFPRVVAFTRHERRAPTSASPSESFRPVAPVIGLLLRSHW